MDGKTKELERNEIGIVKEEDYKKIRLNESDIQHALGRTTEEKGEEAVKLSSPTGRKAVAEHEGNAMNRENQNVNDSVSNAEPR